MDVGESDVGWWEGASAEPVADEFGGAFGVAVREPVDGMSLALELSEPDVLGLGEGAYLVEEEGAHVVEGEFAPEVSGDEAVLEPEPVEALPGESPVMEEPDLGDESVAEALVKALADAFTDGLPWEPGREDEGVLEGLCGGLGALGLLCYLLLMGEMVPTGEILRALLRRKRS